MTGGSWFSQRVIKGQRSHSRGHKVCGSHAPAPPGQTLQGRLHYKQRHMQASSALIATYLISAVSDRHNNSSTKSNPDAPPPSPPFFNTTSNIRQAAIVELLKSAGSPPPSFCQGALGRRLSRLDSGLAASLPPAVCENKVATADPHAPFAIPSAEKVSQER